MRADGLITIPLTELESLRAERDRLKAALEIAGDVICGEFCASKHHRCCIETQEALKAKS